MNFSETENCPHIRVSSEYFSGKLREQICLECGQTLLSWDDTKLSMFDETTEGKKK